MLLNCQYKNAKIPYNKTYKLMPNNNEERDYKTGVSGGNKNF